ncbi:MAG: response regulator [Acidobacteria bacterium]|nr:response regulator [Acidobacteriota bacterium]
MPASETQRILVVDDDEFVRNLVRVILRRAGYEADAASDGGEALEKIAGFKYDLIMLDLMMPRIDGLEVLQRLGGHQTVPPIVVMTAADDAMVERIPRQFVKAVIRKPFDVSELTTLVAGAMSN